MFERTKAIWDHFFGKHEQVPAAKPVKPVKTAPINPQTRIASPLKFIIASGADAHTVNRAKRLAKAGQGYELQKLAQSIANK